MPKNAKSSVIFASCYNIYKTVKRAIKSGVSEYSHDSIIKEKYKLDHANYSIYYNINFLLTEPKGRTGE